MKQIIESVSVDLQSNSVVVGLGFCKLFVPHTLGVYDVSKFTNFSVNFDVVEFDSGNTDFPEDALCVTTAVFGEGSNAVVRYTFDGTRYRFNSNVEVETELQTKDLFAKLEKTLRKAGCVTWIEED